MNAPAATTVRPSHPSRSPDQVSAWASAVEAGVLAAAALADPDVPWRGDATEEELRALRAAGVRAKQDLVTANLGLVGAVLGPYTRGGASAADLFQEGCLGLIAAVERFDHRRGVRFSTYATYWIRTCVSAETARLASGVALSTSRNDQLRAAHGVETALIQDLGRLPTTAEVAEAIGRDERWTASLLAQRGAQSLDDLDDRALDRLAAAAAVGDGAVEREPEVWVRRLLASLTTFDRQVLELRLGFGGRSPTSFAAVARELGVPVGRVRRAEARALEELRERCPHEVAATAAS